MDSLIVAAAQALASGDVLGGLKRVSLRDDPPALALRGIAMAQLGDYVRARALLRRAGRAFGPTELVARMRCVVAEAEVALAMRDLTGSTQALEDAAEVLEAHRDSVNALHARLVALRQRVLLGELPEADRRLRTLNLKFAPPALRALAELTAAERALRSIRVSDARGMLARAREASEEARIPSLRAEIEQVLSRLGQPAAKQVQSGVEKLLTMDDVEVVLQSGAVVIDAIRRRIQHESLRVSLTKRPVLARLMRALGLAWPSDVDRASLIACAFDVTRPNETHRARLRVEVGRLRRLLSPLLRLEATRNGFALRAAPGQQVIVLLPVIDTPGASLVALLSDGQGWSTSALALAMGASQRTVQRALAELQADGKLHSVGRGRSKRWLSAPLTGFATTLLLPAQMPAD